MPDTKRPLKVFLSYASQDKPVVQELSRRLADEGWIDAWLDVKKLLPGQDWRTKIEEAVEDSDIVIICLSNNSVTKEGYVQKELRYAREIALEKPEETIFLVPLRLDDCEVPRGLRFYQWVDYFGEKKEESFSALIESLKLRYDQKLNLEEAERARKEKLEREIAERIAQEKASREKAEKEAAEKARLEAEELARHKEEKEKAERDAKDKIAREKAEKEATEKSRLESEKRARQKAAREKSKRDAAAKEKVKQETAEKPKPTAVKQESVEDKPALEEVETQISQHKSGNQIVFWVVGLVIVVALAIGLSSLNNNPQSIVALTSTRASLPTNASEVAESLASLPTEITDAKGVTMRLVPAGEFTMGSETYNDEKPIHQVYLDAFYMDKYEVTNAAYKACVDVGGCTPPHQTYSSTRSSYYGNSQFDNYPVIYVDWNQANAYCEWRGPSAGSGQARLPTEAQWEKAARGTDGRPYPWGKDLLSCDKANYQSSCVGDTSKVGSYPDGVSPYGVYDMAGNVWEWVNDRYDKYYYTNSPSSNPLGPTSSPDRVFRGGSWYTDSFGYHVRSALRNYNSPDVFIDILGFRCARTNP